MLDSDKLKEEAKQSIEFRGHILGPWSGTAGTEVAYCKTCRCQVAICDNPPPNGIDIGGRAVAVDCTYQQETVRWAFTSYGHLLDADTLTFADFAEKIHRHYDLSNGHNWAACDAVFYRGNDLLPDIFRIR